MRRRDILLSGLAFASAGVPPTFQEISMNVRGDRVQANGLDLYFEIHGAGPALILLHGGLGTIDAIFQTLLPALAQHRTVIAPELQGHGHTTDPGRPMTYEAMADDIAALIDHLGLTAPDVAGFSVGGGVAQQLALRHPGKVGRLVVISAPSATQGWWPEVLAGTAAMDPQAMVGSPWHEAYMRVAPRPGDWPRLVRNVSRLMNAPYDWTPRLAAELKSPALIVNGDADSVRQDHALAVFQALGGARHDGFAGRRSASRLFIVPDAHHLNVLDHPLLSPAMLAFLDR